MKIPQMINQICESLSDSDNNVGPSHSYPTGYCSPRNRFSLLSSKCKRKEERKKILKISLNKLKKIIDAEISLCRSVLVNNTMKKLQQEIRHEKIQKQQIKCPLRYSNNNILNIKSDYEKNKNSLEEIITYFSGNNDKSEDFIIEKDLCVKLKGEGTHVTVNNIDSLDSLAINDLSHTVLYKQENILHSPTKHILNEAGECDTHEILAQFYMPPPTGVLTKVGKDEDVSVVGDDPLAKRIKIEDDASISNNDNFELVYPKNFMNSNSSVTSFINNTLPLSGYTCVIDSEFKPFNCGHSAMLGEIQNNLTRNITVSP